MGKGLSRDTLSACQYLFQIRHAVDDKIQSLQPAIPCRIHEIHHLYAILPNVLDDVLLGKLVCRFAYCSHYRVRA